MYEKPPRLRRFFVRAETPLSGGQRGRGTLRVGVCSSGPLAALRLGCRVLVRQHPTQPGTLEYNFSVV